MVSSIYYIIGVLVLLSLFSIILRFRKIHSVREWKEKYEKIIGKIPTKKEFRSNKEYSLLQSATILGSFELIWIICGFFTVNWHLFALVLLVSYLINFIIQPIKFSLLHKILSFTFLLSRLSLYLYLILNHFYLHQDTYSIFRTYIKW